MKRYPKIKTLLRDSELPEQQEVVVSDISISKLIDDGLLVLYREVKQLKLLSAKGKLTPNDARDLRDHLKLLFELKDRELDYLSKLSDEALEGITESSNDNEQVSSKD